MTRHRLVALAVMAGLFAVFQWNAAPSARAAGRSATGTAAPVKEIVGRVRHTEAQWRKLLTPEQFRILREKGTEIAFTGALWNNHKAGIYRCAACGLSLYDGKTKFDSGTGWPSFWAPIDPSHLTIGKDNSLGVERDEVLCARCGGHLGHVFDDGPAPTYKRYCMNSAAMTFAAAR